MGLLSLFFFLWLGGFDGGTIYECEFGGLFFAELK